MAGDEKNVGSVAIDDGIDPLAPLTQEVRKGLAALLAAMQLIGDEIIRLDVAAAPVIQSQHPKMRVFYVIVNPTTAGTIIVRIGESQYPFTLTAQALAVIPFPLLIERGVNIQATGTDGIVYLIGAPE